MKRNSLYVVLSLLLLLLAACGQTAPEATAVPPTAAPDEYAATDLAAFAALPEVAPPADYEITEEMVDLGRMLYYENRISISQELSCNSCHLLDNYGVDGLQFSLGHEGKPVGRNSPTVYNAALHITQFWDGRAADVEAQAQGPILAAGEMGMPDPEYVIQVLNSIPGYLPLFQAAFPDDPDPISYDNVGRAIGAFERYLLTPGPLHALLAGDETALNDQEKRGLSLFVATGCTSCHYGDAIGGKRYAVLGQITPYPDVTDEGRFAITGKEEDRHAFKVPSLLNIAQTGPYMHDGGLESLDEVVKIMATYQLGKDLTDAQVSDIVAFLNALTGEVPADYIAVPEFPPSGPDTPGPYEYEATTSSN